jgi:hypothetical protein
MIYNYINNEIEFKPLTEADEIELYSAITEQIYVLDEQLESLSLEESVVLTEGSREDYIDLLKDSKAKIKEIRKNAKEAKKNKDKTKYINALKEMKDVLQKAKSKIKTIKPTKVETAVALIIAFLKSVVFFWAGVSVGNAFLAAKSIGVANAVAYAGGAMSGYSISQSIPTFDSSDGRKFKNLSADEKLARFNPYRNNVLMWLDNNITYIDSQIKYVKRTW